MVPDQSGPGLSNHAVPRFHVEDRSGSGGGGGGGEQESPSSVSRD